MLNYEQMVDISTNANVIFYRRGCPHCAQAQVTMDKLVEAGHVDEYFVYYADEEFTAKDLKKLVKKSGWKGGMLETVTKPQIFMKGEYIGGNDSFQRSDWAYKLLD